MSNPVICVTSLSPVANLGEYLRAIARFPKLEPQQERDLAQRLRRDNDPQAAWQLVTSHLRYVATIARGYLGYGIAYEDLIQEGNIGLMEAVKRFDPDEGVPLRAYAAYSIRYHIHEFIIRNWRLVKVATTKARRKLFFKLRSTKEQLTWLNHREAARIAAKMDVNVDDVTEMEVSMYLSDQSLDMGDGNDGSGAVLDGSYLAETVTDPGRLAEDDDFDGKSRGAIAQALKQLDDRSRRILQARWLGENRETLQTLAEEFGVSIERVRQLEAAAMNKVRTYAQRAMAAPGPV